MNKEALLESVKFDEKGLVPVIAQDYHSKKVRMLAYMNKEALIKTLETGKMYYYSRSRNKLWLKGETSSNYQYVKGISIDCDGDTLLVQIEQQNGISCHTGNATCFYQELEEGEVTKKLPATKQVADDEKTKDMLLHLFTIIEERKQNPKAGSYTNYLLDKGINKILKKVGEEATEVIIAAKEEDKGELTFEVADLLYHLTVLLSAKEMNWGQIAEELEKRH